MATRPHAMRPAENGGQSDGRRFEAEQSSLLNKFLELQLAVDGTYGSAIRSSEKRDGLLVTAIF